MRALTFLWAAVRDAIQHIVSLFVCGAMIAVTTLAVGVAWGLVVVTPLTAYWVLT